MSEANKSCKICGDSFGVCCDEGFTCFSCSKGVHAKCLKNGPPGALNGDLFFSFTCSDCSPTKNDVFQREKLSWLKVLVLVLYHLQTRSPGLSKKGFFHWRNHVAAFIDKNWNILFLKEFKQKKKWIGTVAGTLSHFNNVYFKSGTNIVNEPAYWALTYPKLTPLATLNIYSEYTEEKVKLKFLKIQCDKAQLFQEIINKQIENKDLLAGSSPLEAQFEPIRDEVKEETAKIRNNKRKNLLPTFERTSKKLLKLNSESPIFLNEHETPSGSIHRLNSEVDEKRPPKEQIKLLDPMCHYNTSLSFSYGEKHAQMRQRLMGGIRKDLILSPYSSIYLKPYIRRDLETYPNWLKLMTEVQLRANQGCENWRLPSRASIDYTYVQPEHIPAINSLCNTFFWPGIDISECLQYPDFSCVVMYKKLIVGFAFLVPDVKFSENYVSFMFTRPGWRNVGIGKFMLYHLIQTSLGKDLTLHVSINNPALFLYQKFGFKVESVVLGFYDKYIRSETNESKHAFFCRLER